MTETLFVEEEEKVNGKEKNTGLTVFENNEFGEIRTLVKNNQPYFVAKDVCNALDLNNSRQTIADLKSNYEAIGIDYDDVISTDVIYDSIGRLQDTTIISETGLYDLVMQSRKQSALKFKHWISSEVLPSIRKHGFYGTDTFMEMAVNDTDTLISMLQTYKFEREQRQLAERQRDEAIRTKAWISDKKTATAMATASVVVRENDKLKQQIGDSKNFKQVKAISWLADHFNLNIKSVYSQIGKQLSKISEKKNLPTLQIEDSKFGTVKAYHLDAIQCLNMKLNEDLNMMKKYRIDR